MQAWRRARQPRVTQEHLAAVLHLQRSQVSQIETGHRTLKLRESILLYQAFGLSLEALLGGISQADLDVLSILQSLPGQDQREVYMLFYRGIMLLAAHRRRQQAVQESPADEEP